MSPEEFKNLYLCDWTPTPQAQRLYEIAEEYHRRTEDRDRVWCTGVCRHTGDVMPRGPLELSGSCAFAREVRCELIERNPDIDPKIIKAAISRHGN